MSHEVLSSSTPCDCQASKSPKIKPTRHLDHLPDLLERGGYSMMPNEVKYSRWDGYTPEAKYDLLDMVLSHSEHFHIKSQYLRRRFDQRTITKYMDELVADGCILIEAVTFPNGRKGNLHHTRPLADWKIVENDRARAKSKDQKATPSPPGVPAHAESSCPGVAAHGVLEHGLNKKPSANKTKSLNSHTQAPSAPEAIHENPHTRLARLLLEKLAVHSVEAKPSLVAAQLGLVHQNLSWSWETIESRLDELALFVAARWGSTPGDASHLVWVWCRNWREPSKPIAPKQGGRRREPQKFETYESRITAITEEVWREIYENFKAAWEGDPRNGAYLTEAEHKAQYTIISAGEFDKRGYTKKAVFETHCITEG